MINRFIFYSSKRSSTAAASSSPTHLIKGHNEGGSDSSRVVLKRHYLQQPNVAFLKNGDVVYDDEDYDAMTLQTGSAAADQKWCVVSIAGNTTVVLNRKDDFVKYFKMNMASLTGSEYDHIMVRESLFSIMSIIIRQQQDMLEIDSTFRPSHQVNSITYTPHLIINASLLNWSERGERVVKVMTNLARRNDTLLDLSGVHFNITHFATAEMLMAPKPVAPYKIGSGISLDNESGENDMGASGSDGDSGTNLRLLNTSIDTEKLEAVIFVIVGE